MNAFELSQHIAERLEENGLDYAIGGALALTAWAIPRDTKDVDISVFARDDDIRHWLGQMVPLGDRRLALLDDVEQRFSPS